MKVILTADVKKVGSKGQVVTVADGYALNVLIPSRKAVTATPENLKKHEQGEKDAKARAELATHEAALLLKSIDGKTVSIAAKAGDTGTLFKSLHADAISSALQSELKVTISEDSIVLESPIKKIGTYTVPIRLYGSRAQITVEILVQV
jgi:large subunit ribosomal protein L9